MKAKSKSRKTKPNAARDPMTGELIADRLVKLINQSVYVDWIDSKTKDEWYYFTVLEVNKVRTKVKLKGVYPEAGYYADLVWVDINEIKDVWRAPNALEGMEFKKIVMRLVEDSIGSVHHSIVLNAGNMCYNEEEMVYNDGFESGLSQAKEELESLLNRVKVS